MRWLTRAQAAKRVGRDLSTIYRWERSSSIPLAFVGGFVKEADLLNADRVARSRVGRPRKTDEGESR